MTLPQSDFYVKYCKFFNQFGWVKKLGESVRSKKLVQISGYLNENFDLLPNEVMTASVVTFLLILIPLMVLFFQINFLLGILIPIMTGYITANKILKYPITKYDQIHHTLLQYSDLAFQDLTLILNTTNSIFDALEFITEAQYPVLSEKFREMIFRINFFGESPESLLSEFITKLPTGNLKERLITVMATKFHPDKMLEQLESLAGEKKLEYEGVTRQLESKLVIVVGICMFFPFIITLVLTMLGSAANYLCIIFIPAFIVIIQKLKTGFLKSHFELFGETGVFEKDEFDYDNSELVDFLQLLTFFGNELKRGVPQEVALLKASRSYQGSLKNSIGQSVREIFWGSKSFRQGWVELKTLFTSTQIHFLMDLIDRMLYKSSIETGNRILSALQQLKINREMIQERESVIKAQQFKVKFLVFISAAILGMVAGNIITIWRLRKNGMENPGRSRF